MSKVQELIQRKREELRGRKPETISVPDDDRRVRWSKNRFHVIAEIKRASLSAGSIRPDLDLHSLAASYENAGVAAISVLTEQNYFGGAIDDLREVHKAVKLPLLQKDFVIAPEQILEAKAAGASFILIIVRFLEPREITEMLALCRKLQLNAILEITNEQDLEKVPSDVEFLGVNSRDLETLQINTNKFRELRNLLPDTFLIAESGIGNARLLQEIIDLGYHGALIGEHFLRCKNPGEEAAAFVNAATQPRVKICGITSKTDAEMAIEHGASALGFIFAESPRQIDPQLLAEFRNNIPDGILRVGVFRGQNQQEVKSCMAEFKLDAAQVYDFAKPAGWTPALQFWHAKTVYSPEKISSGSQVLWDIKGKQRNCWEKLSQMNVFALAGGLDAGNVSEAIRICHPKWVDVARGVEESPGKKDANRLKLFMQAVRNQ